MKKIIAMLVAIVMCASVLAVLTYADISDTAPMSGYTATYFPYYESTTMGIWAGLKDDSYDFTTHTGSELSNGDYGDFKPSTEYDTFFMTFYGGSFGKAGNDINGFCFVGQGDWTGAQMKGVVSFYYNADVHDNWNKWTKVEVSSVDVEKTNGLPVYVFWFKEVVKTDSLLVHFSSAYDASGYSIGMKSQIDGNDWCRACYEPSKLPAEGGDPEPEPETPPVVVNLHPDFVGMAMQQPTGERTTYPGPYDQSAIQSVHYNLYANFNNGVTAGGISFTENNTSTATNGSWFADAKIYVTNEKWSEAQGSAWSLDGMTEVPAKHSVDGLVHTYKFGKAVNAKTILIVWGGEADGGHLQFSTSNVTILEPSADTSDMLSISIAVASVAILGTAAAIVMKKRKED